MHDIDARLTELFDEVDLDVRNTIARKQSTGISPRFMDQKVTPDVLSFIADCVNNLPKSSSGPFTTRDIWENRYFAKNIKEVWGKPDVNEETAQHEYDKLLAQPLKALAFAGVLTETKNGNSIEFSVIDDNVMIYLGLRTQNAFEFLFQYLNTVLAESGVLSAFHKYRDSDHTQDDFLDLKEAFERFITTHTPIQNLTEARRIFPKVLNILAVRWGIPGTKSGRVEKYPTTYADLMYNSQNFRDLGKSKSTTRALSAQPNPAAERFVDNEMGKAKKYIAERHGPASELHDRWSNGNATQVHHIVPKSVRPDLRAVPENLILLTATQHQAKAHPGNVTSKIDRDYQIDCLIAKVTSVAASLVEQDGFYSRSGLLSIIAAATSLKLPEAIPLSTIPARLREHRAQQLKSESN